MDGLAFLLRLLLAPLGGLGDLFKRSLTVGLNIAHLVAQAVRDPRGGNSAVADGGVEIVHRAEGQALEDGCDNALVKHIIKRKAVVPQLLGEHFAAADDILLAALLLVPLLYLGARGAALCDIEPVAAGAGRGLGSAYLDDIAVLEHIVIGDDAAVDLCADHVVADVGMDAVSKVDRRRTGGEVYNIALRGEHKDLVGKEVDLHVMEEVLRVGLLLALKESAYPRELVLIPRAHDGVRALAHLILPVRGNAVLGGVVHVPGAYLHLEGDALGADDRGVHALVHIGLRRGYIVLEAPRHGLEHIMDDAEDVIAVGYRIDDDAESAEVEDAVYVKVLGILLR